MDVLTSETCSALYKEIKNQVTSSWSLFIQLWFMFFCRFGFGSKNDYGIYSVAVRLWYYSLTFIFKIVQPQIQVL
jgi:hypothetical protein